MDNHCDAAVIALMLVLLACLTVFFFKVGTPSGDDVGSSGIVASRHWENPRRILSRGKMSVASDMAGFRFGAGTSRANAP